MSNREPEPPLETLTRWEDAGAGWRLAYFEDQHAVVELLTCYGEPVDVLRSDDAGLLAYLERRPASDHPS